MQVQRITREGGERDKPSRDLVDQPILWAETKTFLYVTIVVMWIGLTSYSVVHYLYLPGYPLRIVVSWLLGVVGLISWVLLMLDRLKMAVIVFGVGTWAVLTLLAFLYGGVASSTVFVFPLLILFSGWVVSPRAAWIVAVLMIIATLVSIVAGRYGLMPDAPPVLPSAQAVTQCFVYIFSAIIISFVVRSYRDRLRDVRNLSHDLADRTAALQATESDLNRAQAVAGMGSWVYDLSLNRMTLSDETCRIFGLPKGTAGSHDTYMARVHSEDHEQVEQSWRAALAGVAVFDHEHRITFNKSVRWVRQCAEFQFDETGRPLRAVGTTQDITQRKLAGAERDQLEAQLRESQKMEALGTLAGGIAHDFNNVLASILGNVSLARQDVGGSHAARQSLDEIEKAGMRARALVQQILAFGRRQISEMRCVALAPVLEDAARLLRSTQPVGVNMSLMCAPDAPLVMADATQVSQVLVNLCTNAWHAVEARDKPGVVNVQLSAVAFTEVTASTRSANFAFGNPKAGRYACLTVSDNGAGMDEQTRRRIFEPFFTTKPVGKGTGLGLAVVHGIVQSHQGCIEIESVAGAGTSFSIYFPATDDMAAVASPVTPLPPAINAASHAADGASKHVLYVDDDEALVILVTRVLERRGYRVSGYEDAAEAMAALRANPHDFDLVVTDYNMPGTSGLVVARTVKEIRSNLPVAMASGYLTADLRAEALAAGVSELIQKPDSVDELCNTVARLVGANNVK